MVKEEIWWNDALTHSIRRLQFIHKEKKESEGYCTRYKEIFIFLANFQKY